MQPRPLFNDDHAHAERGEHAGVFDADDAAAHHDQRARHRAACDKIWSLLIMLRPLMGTLGFTAGFVPVAMTIYSPSNSPTLLLFATRMWCGSMKLPMP